jgi:ParB-like chromosome segregation protein Spo0J
MNEIKSRIVAHVKVRAGDLVPHELNPRRHSAEQRELLRALYEEIGFARSVLAYRLPDGRLKLIDGHLRQSIEPNMEIEVEVLDVDDAEARKLLLALDPLAQLADYDESCLEELRKLSQSSSNMLNAFWAGLQKRDAEIIGDIEQKIQSSRQSIPACYQLLIECATEQEQLALLARFTKEGLRCKALIT